MNIIEELYFGKINPSTKIQVEKPTFYQAMNRVVENEELLTARLSGMEKKLLLELLNEQSTVLGELTVAHFIAGFRLGAGLMAEVSPVKIKPYLRE